MADTSDLDALERILTGIKDDISSIKGYPDLDSFTTEVYKLGIQRGLSVALSMVASVKQHRIRLGNGPANTTPGRRFPNPDARSENRRMQQERAAKERKAALEAYRRQERKG